MKTVTVDEQQLNELLRQNAEMKADIGILSNETTAQVYRVFSPDVNQTIIITCDLNNSIAL